MQTLEFTYITEFIEYLDSLYYNGYTEVLQSNNPDSFQWEYENFIRTYHS